MFKFVICSYVPHKNWITACKIWPQINKLCSKLLLTATYRNSISSYVIWKACNVKYLKGNIHYIHAPQKALVKSAESISLRNFSVEMKHMTVFDTPYKPPIAMKWISVSLRSYLGIGVIKTASFFSTLSRKIVHNSVLPLSATTLMSQVKNALLDLSLVQNKSRNRRLLVNIRLTCFQHRNDARIPTE